MNQVTVVGMLVDQLGLFQQHSTVVTGSHWPQNVEHRCRSYRLPPSGFRRQQPAARLNMSHDYAAQCGRLVALEEDGAGLWAVFVSDQLGLLRLTEPQYLSGELAWRGSDVDAHDIEIRSVALTEAPAGNHLQPARILAGDLSRTLHRERWRLPGAQRDRLERAAQRLKYRKPDDPVTVEDWTPERQRLLSQRYRNTAEAWAAIEQYESQRPPGPLRHSAPYRGVIAVR